ncbi:MAG TPA: ArsR family transcriptional regulator [Methanosarcinaceae archaeon]|nr:ArsR family transcriptional regulator [Methanosarcinaceae archaeon]
MNEKQPIGTCPPYLISNAVLDTVHAAMSEDVKRTSGLFKLLSDPIRLHILKALEVQDLCVCVLVEVTDYKHSALSYHLKLLKDANLVDSKRDKSFQIYFLTVFGRSLIGLLEKEFKNL